jgi:putative amide transporter protein
MVGVVLLYVGVVLIVNGIWLIGAAYAAAAARRMPAMETAAVGGGGYAGATAAGRGLAEEAAAGQELGGEPVVAQTRRAAESMPFFIQNREVAILNIFTGFIGVAIAVTFIVDGGTNRIPALGLPLIRAGGVIFLFAFTYLWVAYNQYANAGGRALGWYSAFVAATVIFAGVWQVQNSPSNNTADLWLAANYFAWAVLWLLFFALLTLELPIARITGWVAILEGMGTAWALALALLWGKLAITVA